MAKNEIPEEALSHFTRLIETHSEMELKGGAKMQYTSMNGNMYTLLGKTGQCGLRMSKEDGTAFMEQFSAGLLMQHGAVLNGYVEIPPEVLPDTEALTPWLEKSHEFAMTLKPKPTKK